MKQEEWTGVSGRIKNLWRLVRVAIVSAGFVAATIFGSNTVPPGDSSWPMLGTGFVFGALGLLFVIGVQAFNKRSAPYWRRPAWSINPFLLGEPLQFFHLASWYFIASGIGDLIHGFVTIGALDLDRLVLLSLGLGLYAGVQLCILAFRHKMTKRGSAEACN